LIIGITIVVVAVPEGLPMAVTISLAYSVHKMRQEQNLVRQLSASETMGGAQEICTDKTGTLTQNKMTVVEVYAEDSISNVDQFSEKTREVMFESICVNSTANIIYDAIEKKDVRVGNQTECGMIEMVRRNGHDYLELRKKNPPVF
jgi:Ca2+ transporting ATPase